MAVATFLAPASFRWIPCFVVPLTFFVLMITSSLIVPHSKGKCYLPFLLIYGCEDPMIENMRRRVPSQGKSWIAKEDWTSTRRNGSSENCEFHWKNLLLRFPHLICSISFINWLPVLPSVYFQCRRMVVRAPINQTLHPFVWWITPSIALAIQTIKKKCYNRRPTSTHLQCVIITDQITWTHFFLL